MFPGRPAVVMLALLLLSSLAACSSPARQSEDSDGGAEGDDAGTDGTNGTDAGSNGSGGNDAGSNGGDVDAGSNSGDVDAGSDGGGGDGDAGSDGGGGDVDAGSDGSGGDVDAGGSGGGGSDGSDAGSAPPDPDCAIGLTDGRRISGEGSPLVRTDPRCGALVYARYANEGRTAAVNALPDFSYAGYEGGGVAIPDVPTVVTLGPGSGDDRARIQAAIDEVGARPLDAQGFRGAVQLTAGRYVVRDTLVIAHSGVVLRGAGQGDSGTVLVATRRQQHDLIAVRAATTGFRRVAGTETAITSPLVPVGSRSFTVASAAALAVGDVIGVVRAPDARWIEDLDMAQWNWDAASFDIPHERTIVAVDGDRITVDIPLLDTIEDRYGGGLVVRLDTSARLRHCGVEDLRLVSEFASPEDEDHGWNAVTLRHVESSWVRRVTARHFGYSAVTIEGDSRDNTVEEVAQLDPISQITGSRRYSFYVSDSSVGNLFQRCYAREGRHNFVTGGRVPGPNVWLDCIAVDSHNDEGPHLRWATGMLLDNVRAQEIHVQNRGESGSGHGWAGAQTLFWNIAADEIIVDAPRGAMNWAIGAVGERREGSWVPGEPFGWWESPQQPVNPRSLYLAQLKDRLGEDAVAAVTTPAQRQGRVWSRLQAWAGNGAYRTYDDDVCAGIVQSDVCCPLSCGSCGGTGCSDRPGGAAACCVGAIRDSNRSCEEFAPPCVLP